MKKIQSVSGLLIGSLLVGNIAHADFADGLVGGLVGGAVGSVITNEVYKSNAPKQAQQAPATQQRSVKQQKRYVAPQKK